MDEGFLKRIFEGTAVATSVKIIRDKVTNVPVGYGFLEFESHEVAARVLEKYNGNMNPRTSKPYRLNWGVHGGGKSRGKVLGSGFEEKRSSWAGRNDVNENNPISVIFCFGVFLGFEGFLGIFEVDLMG